MTPQEQLCEKMRVEQSAYCLWLTAQPPEEILHHAYEYSVREDIILATEEMNLTLAQVRALLKSPAPLADVYKDFSKLETDYMSIVAQCVEDRADDLLKKEQQQNPPKVYRQSVTYAREHGELQQYHASCHLNERCRDEIDAALAQRFDGMRLGAGAVEQVVAEYGLERTKCSTVYRSRLPSTACVTGLICFGWLVVSSVMRPERGCSCRGDFQRAAYCAYGTVRASMSFCCHDSKMTTC